MQTDLGKTVVFNFNTQYHVWILTVVSCFLLLQSINQLQSQIVQLQKHLDLSKRSFTAIDKTAEPFIKCSTGSDGLLQISCSHCSHTQPKQPQVSACAHAAAHLMLLPVGQNNVNAQQCPSLFCRPCFSKGCRIVVKKGEHLILIFALVYMNRLYQSVFTGLSPS